MYKLIRRISSSFFPRPDRPWSEDATSTAPQIGRKRRLSTSEPDEDREQTPVKKFRADSDAPPTPVEVEQPQEKAKETEEVKEVTKGVGEVDLEEKIAQPEADLSATEEGAQEVATDSTQETAAAEVPLPDSPPPPPAEDVDAEGDTDSEETKPTDPQAETPAPDTVQAADAADDEVPGLSLASSSSDKAETATEAGP